MAWIMENRNNGLAILPATVRLKALDISKDAKYEIPVGHFKASNHWCQEIHEEKQLVAAAENNLAQRLPPGYEEKIAQFIIKQWRAHRYLLQLVASMYESPIQIDMPSNQTVSKTGEKTVKIQTTGNEKNCLMVVLIP